MHSRRSLLGTLAAFLPAGIVGRLSLASNSPPAPGLALARVVDLHGISESDRGIIDVAAWQKKFRGCRLLLDGKDITRECYLVNLGEGWADCYLYNEWEVHPVTGKPGQFKTPNYVQGKPGEPLMHARVRRRGKLEIRPPQPR